MNTTLTRIAMAAPIVAALLALTSGWDAAQAQPGPNFPTDSVPSDTVVVDPAPPKPPKWDLPVVDIDDIDVAPPVDDPAPPADPAPSDDSDHGDHSDHHDDDHDHDSDHRTTTVVTTVRPTVQTTAPGAAETDSEFQASDATNASETISPKYLENTGVQVPAGTVFGLGALLLAVIGWAAVRHHRASMSI